MGAEPVEPVLPAEIILQHQEGFRPRRADDARIEIIIHGPTDIGGRPQGRGAHMAFGIDQQPVHIKDHGMNRARECRHGQLHGGERTFRKR